MLSPIGLNAFKNDPETDPDATAVPEIEPVTANQIPELESPQPADPLEAVGTKPSATRVTRPQIKLKPVSKATASPLSAVPTPTSSPINPPQEPVSDMTQVSSSSQPAQTGTKAPLPEPMSAVSATAAAAASAKELAEKREPGVYVRNTKPQSDDLEYLWGKEKAKDRDQSRFLGIYFLAGILLGAVTGVSATLYLVYQTSLLPATGDPTAAGPVIERQVDVSEQPVAPAQVNTPDTDTTVVPEPVDAVDKVPSLTKKPENFITIIKEETQQQQQPEAKVKTPVAAPPQAEIKVQTYTVKSGDTLGGIAYKYYDSVDPKYIDKIKRANNMKSEHALKLDQELQIPPKNY